MVSLSVEDWNPLVSYKEGEREGEYRPYTCHILCVTFNVILPYFHTFKFNVLLFTFLYTHTP